MSAVPRLAPVAGIDLGGTNIRVAVHDPAGPPLPTGSAGVTSGPAPRSLEELRDVIGRLGAQSLGGVGIAIPGLVEATTCRWVPNLAYLDGVDLAAEVRAATRAAMPVAVGNDAHLALLAEARWGAAARMTDVILLAIGTGIGSAVLAGGSIVRGSRGAAASFGWACADPDDSGDAVHGWLERHASGSALDRVGARWDPPKSGTEVVGAARGGDRTAAGELARLGATLGTVLAGAVALLDPQLVLVSGGLADALDVVMPALREAMERQLPAHLRQVPVAAAHFGSGASLQGALLAARTTTTWWEVTR